MVCCETHLHRACLHGIRDADGLIDVTGEHATLTAHKTKHFKNERNGVNFSENGVTETSDIRRRDTQDWDE